MLPIIPGRAMSCIFLEIFYIAFIRVTTSPLYQFGISHKKLMDYMMAAKLVVMASDDVEAIARTIRRLAAPPSPIERTAMCQKERAFILRHETHPQLARRYVRAVEV